MAGEKILVVEDEGLTAMELGDKPVFCLLNVKCNPIAKDIGVDLGDNVVLKL